MLRLLDTLFRCYYNLASKGQPPYSRIATAHTGLWLFLAFFIIGLYALLMKLFDNEYLPPISRLLYVVLCGTAAGASVLYYTRHPASYWDAYQGDKGNRRVFYALLGVFSYGFLAFLSSWL
ncbi:hypothetical protein [Hymenobacter negativus]|uniref:Uncharacterized protein n=1 Tax=Hymenobacter negativus TaxID=2795026 RepID=A0ABS3QA69_9BACT|nr:hypothetical protein [Hymenobacter negativus]MBO2007883.1 hypothetical protein [Hymenobacter negativus]